MNTLLENDHNLLLDPSGPVSPQIRHILRNQIVSNKLTPGTKISEPELARTFQVSRQPVREAFITLVNEGLLEIRPQRGTLVKRIDYEAVLDGRFIREAVEADIVRRLANDNHPSLVSSLHEQIRLQKQSVKANPHLFMELDERFHDMLANAAGYRKVWTYLDNIKAQMDRVRNISDYEFSVERLIDQHSEIVDCIAKKRPEEAEKAMRQHLQEILKSLPKVQELYPDYFENSRAIRPE